MSLEKPLFNIPLGGLLLGMPAFAMVPRMFGIDPDSP